MSYRTDYNFVSRLDRAFQQRIYVIDCSNNSIESAGEEGGTFKFEVMGNSDTAYNITLKQGGKIYCSCPDHDANWKLCKHMLFVLIRILGISKEKVYSDYFQLLDDDKKSFNVTDETITLCQAYLKKRESMLLEGVSKDEMGSGVNRKSIGEDDSCPICLDEFSSTKEKIDWCKGQCGNNVHHSCFVKWSTKQTHVSCVYCRGDWVW